MGKEGYGPLRRPMAKKKMTVEMTEPFVWPEEPKDFAPYVFLFALYDTLLFPDNGSRRDGKRWEART